MSIIELFEQYFINSQSDRGDYSLVEYDKDVLVGVDKDGNCSLVINSSTPDRNQIMQKTKMISLECNSYVTYFKDDTINSAIVHVLKCFSKEKKDINLFLELTSLFITKNDYSEENMLDVFKTMVNFFKNDSEPSDFELRGLYAELYTIKKYSDTLHLEKYWQKKDKLKFDFSITDRVKIEVKSTINQNRVHHFKHDQLMSDLYEIYVVSYVMRHDDEGLSLYDLLIESKRIFQSDPERLMRIDLVLKNTSEMRLKSIKFDTDLTDRLMHIYKAEDIPKFNQMSPDGVFNAEYDCDLENVDYITNDRFVSEILEKQG